MSILEKIKEIWEIGYNLSDFYSRVKVKTYCLVENGQVIYKKADNLLDRGPQSIVGNEIIKYGFVGDKGKNGTNFFGLLLKKPDNTREWLVVTFLTSDGHCLLDGHWIWANPIFYDIQKPLMSAFVGHPTWDLFTSQIIHSTISNVELQDRSCKITYLQHSDVHVLEILDSDPRLPPLPGWGKKAFENRKTAKALKKDELIGEFLIFMEEDGSIDLRSQPK